MRNKYISQAKDNYFYSSDELKSLQDFIEGYIVDISPFIPQELSNIDNIFMEMEHNNGMIDVKRDETYVFGFELDINKKLNFLQYLLVFYPRIFLFLTQVKKENTLVYMNDPVLKPFVLWRLAR